MRCHNCKGERFFVVTVIKTVIRGGKKVEIEEKDMEPCPYCKGQGEIEFYVF